MPIYTRQWLRFWFLNPNLHITSVFIHIGSLLCANRRKWQKLVDLGSVHANAWRTYIQCATVTVPPTCICAAESPCAIKVSSPKVYWWFTKHSDTTHMCAAQLNEQSQLITVRNCGRLKVQKEEDAADQSSVAENFNKTTTRWRVDV